MKYENAKDLLPNYLLEQVQRYAAGKLLYIPKTEEPKGWGEASGTRKKLEKRNASIQFLYSSGKTISELAEEFYLSTDSIKKIVYGKKRNLPVYSPTTFSAAQYSDAGMGEEWLRTYMTTNQLSLPNMEDHFVTGVVRIPLRLINTVPPQENDATIQCNGEPLIVVFQNRTFYVPYQHDSFLELKKKQMNSHPAFIITSHEDYAYFWQYYGRHFQK